MPTVAGLFGWPDTQGPVRMVGGCGVAASAHLDLIHTLVVVGCPELKAPHVAHGIGLFASFHHPQKCRQLINALRHFRVLGEEQRVLCFGLAPRLEHVPGLIKHPGVRCESDLQGILPSLGSLSLDCLLLHREGGLRVATGREEGGTNDPLTSSAAHNHQSERYGEFGYFAE